MENFKAETLSHIKNKPTRITAGNEMTAYFLNSIFKVRLI